MSWLGFIQGFTFVSHTTLLNCLCNRPSVGAATLFVWLKMTGTNERTDALCFPLKWSVNFYLVEKVLARQMLCEPSRLSRHLGRWKASQGSGW